jgi:hypothetical protein
MEIEIPAEISADDLETLPDAGYRYELHEGNLVLISPVTIWHYRAGTIHQFVLDRSAEGEPVYRQKGETRLSELEKGDG